MSADVSSTDLKATTGWSIIFSILIINIISISLMFFRKRIILSLKILYHNTYIIANYCLVFKYFKIFSKNNVKIP